MRHIAQRLKILTQNFKITCLILVKYLISPGKKLGFLQDQRLMLLASEELLLLQAALTAASLATQSHLS